jgi:spore coat polysaccharide biosynthesis protein SpsF (cytidylyltransferase family)
LYQGDIVVRVTGDCPLIDAGIIDRVINSLDDNDFASNVVRRTFPRGLDVEVMTRETLERLNNELWSHHPDREHVCSVIYKIPDAFNIVSVVDDEDNSDLVWCVDDEEDLDRVTNMLKWRILPYKEMLKRVSGYYETIGSGDATWGVGAFGPEDRADEGDETIDEWD